MSEDNREIAAAILANALIRNNAGGGLPVKGAVETYYQILDSLSEEHDRRLQQKHVPGFDRPLG